MPISKLKRFPDHFAPLLGLCILLALAGCSNNTTSPDTSLTVLYTNDEHGWMEGMEESQGAANIYSLWQEQEGYQADGDFLLLSGGDNWTGPAVSTWTAGESMVDVMNTMQYDASAVGNHEFDFGLAALRQRASEAEYPYLSANIMNRASGAHASELGILPYTIKSVAGLQVGIIGLTTTETPSSTNPNNVQSLVFADYESSLRTTVPALQAEGIDLLFVISHVCVAELDPLIRSTQDLGIDLVGAGHCNELVARRIGNTVLLGGGFHFTSYAKATFTIDPIRKRPSRVNYTTNSNIDVADDAEISQLIAQWTAQTEEFLSEVIAHTDRSYRRADGTLYQSIIDSWLWHDPSADIAITNAGGIRIDMPEGDIDLGTVVAMLPFDNTIFALELSGATISNVIEQGNRPVVAGLQRRSGNWVLTKSGQPLEAEQRYRVLVNSFMYAGGAEEDAQGFDTGINYRQPFQDWLKAQGSDSDNPLDL